MVCRLMFFFYFGATQSFVFLSLSKNFQDAEGTLDSPREVEIADNRTVSGTRVYQRSILNVFEERFSIDLVLIPLWGLKVIIGMDWLGPNGVMIEYEHQLVRVQTPSGGELFIRGERASQGPTLCSTARARRLLHQVCSGFLAYISDTVSYTHLRAHET